MRLYLYLSLLLLLPFFVQGASFSVIINEVAWMGTTSSYNNEWVELYNNTDNEVDLSNWELKSADGTPDIKITGKIPAKGFYLLERTNDDTVMGVTADQIYTGALGNNGEDLKLLDNLGNLIDEVNCSAGWFSGDNATKQTMERTNNSSNWQNSQNPGGTPKAVNSIPIPNTPETAVDNQNPTPNIITYPSGIVFNEILPSPEGADEAEEWIEIYNPNNFEVDLSGWKVQDTEGKITTYTIPNNIKIRGSGYLLLTRPETKITLNNTGDKLMLFQPDGKVVDMVSYDKSLLGQSYNRVNGTWAWSSKLTPASKNVVTENTKEDMQDTIKKEQMISSLSQGVTNQKPFLSVFFIALGIAIFSTITFFFLRNKI